MPLSLNLLVTAATQERFELDFSIPASAWEGIFDRLEIWRSRGTVMGPYEPLHADTTLPARLPASADDPPDAPQTGPSVTIVGKTLELLVNERTEVIVTFTGIDPLTFAQAALQIVSQSTGLLSSYVSGSTLVVQTIDTGLKTALRVVGGDAAPLLRLATSEPGSLAFGRDARIQLRHGLESYGFVDPNGSLEFFYKARFYNTVTSLVSQFSSPFQGTPIAGLALDRLCRCYVDLVDMSGRGLANQEVLISNRFNGAQVDNRVVAGGHRRLLTDASGHAELLIPRGISVTVAIAGTSIARDVVIPTDESIQAINLLASDNGSDDLFTVQVPDIDFAVRRSI